MNLDNYLPATDISLKTGMKLGQYQIINEISRGGMGIIYLAFDSLLNRNVIFKVILFQDNKAKEQSLKRFIREAQICAQLQHPNIVHIYSSGVYQKLPYLVMEYVEGTLLFDYIKQHGEDDYDTIATLIMKIAEALHYIHKKNIIHRDIKPANILVRPDGEPILLDFGIAKMLQSDSWNLTKDGEVLGSFLYMSPEQASGNNDCIDVYSDIYSLGMILYQLLTHKNPYSNSDVTRILNDIQKKHIPLPRSLNSSIPEFLEEIVIKATEKKPENRYKNAQTMARQLRHYLDRTGKVSKEYRKRIWFRQNRLNIVLFCIVLILLGIIAILGV